MASIRIFGLILITAFLASTSYAEGFGQKSKWGIEVDRLQNGTSNEFGVLLGFKHAGYFDGSNVYLGYELHAGTDRGGSPAEDSLTYGGFSFGFDGNYFKAVSYDFGCVIGYGFGTVARYMQSGESSVIQPRIALGLIMTSGYRMAFNAGYLYMPGANGFSTWLFGISLDRKTTSTGSYAE